MTEAEKLVDYMKVELDNVHDDIEHVGRVIEACNAHITHLDVHLPPSLKKPGRG
ncbi:hypothetical protein J2129_001327 [Methanofollis sp. W23]|uniref:hypothetical protein n=1 Tax=Methanofollis sp. W23 TaxID=2817849 RepID=UPI001AE5F21F|nr:hypothetical protein [Methanofollis sp. W23]MBP2145873.1 hypothetical protein [Methanofollis sp. W23]